MKMSLRLYPKLRFNIENKLINKTCLNQITFKLNNDVKIEILLCNKNGLPYDIQISKYMINLN